MQEASQFYRKERGFGLGRSRVSEIIVLGCAGVAFRCLCEGIHRPPVKTGDKMPVHVYGRLDGAMAHLFLDVDNVFRSHDEQARVGVAKRVKGYLP